MVEMTAALSQERIDDLRWRIQGIYADLDKTTQAMIRNPYNAGKVERLTQYLDAQAKDLETLDALIALVER